MSSRTLNGVSGNATNYSLIKFYNLSDLTDISGARVNLGLVGALNVATSPYVSISAPYNALSNQTITLNASNNATPNTLAAYDLSGNMRCNVIESNLLLCSTFNVLPENDPIFSFNGNDFDNIGVINCNSIACPSITSSGSNISFNSKNCTNVGSLTATSLSTPSITSSGTDISFNLKNLTNVGSLTATSISIPSITSSGSNISFNSKNCTNVGAITSTRLSTPTISSSGTNINFDNKDLQNIGNATINDAIYVSNIVAYSIRSNDAEINFNSNKLTNISNVSRQLWAYTNTVANTSTVLSSIPINSQAVMNLTTATLYTFRVCIPFTYNGETTLRLSYVRQIIGSSSGLFIVLGLYDYTGTTLITSAQSAAYNNGGPSADTVSIALGGLGLTVGGNYMVVLADKATSAGLPFYLFSPEISLLY